MTAFPDERLKRCGQCGALYLPRRGGNRGFCSDRCFVTSRGRQESAAESLSRALQNMTERHEREVSARVTVDRRLAAARLSNEVEAYRRSRGEALGLIARLSGDPGLAGYAVRGSRAEREAMRSASPAADCADCQRYGIPAAESYRLHSAPDAPMPAAPYDPAPGNCQHGFWRPSCSQCRAEANRGRWGNGEISR